MRSSSASISAARDPVSGLGAGEVEQHAVAEAVLERDRLRPAGVGHDVLDARRSACRRGRPGRRGSARCSMSTPYSVVPMRSANSSCVSLTHSAGGGTRGKVSMSGWTGMERSTMRRPARSPVVRADWAAARCSSTALIRTTTRRMTAASGTATAGHGRDGGDGAAAGGAPVEDGSAGDRRVALAAAAASAASEVGPPASGRGRVAGGCRLGPPDAGSWTRANARAGGGLDAAELVERRGTRIAAAARRGSPAPRRAGSRRSRIRRCTTNSCGSRPGSRAAGSSKKSQPTQRGARATSHSAACSSSAGDRRK